MKSAFRCTLLIVLLMMGGSPCFALRSIGIVSKQDAKQLGLDVRAEGTGVQVWVELEFKAEGKFKAYHHVELEIRDGEKLLLAYAELREKRLASGNIVVRFLADRAYLDKITLEIVVGEFDAVGYEVRLKDFLEKQAAR